MQLYMSHSPPVLDGTALNGAIATVLTTPTGRAPNAVDEGLEAPT